MLKGFSLLLWFVVFGGQVASALAGQDDYIDDRSTPQMLITSYFNALNRHEFARAWSYRREGALGDDFEAFVEGFAEVGNSEFKLGEILGEGAVGSLYFQVPIVVGYEIKGEFADVFAGCFILKLTQPAIQSPPFSPLHILNGSLVLVHDVAFSEAQPGVCPD